MGIKEASKTFFFLIQRIAHTWGNSAVKEGWMGKKRSGGEKKRWKGCTNPLDPTMVPRVFNPGRQGDKKCFPGSVVIIFSGGGQGFIGSWKRGATYLAKRKKQAGFFWYQTTRRPRGEKHCLFGSSSVLSWRFGGTLFNRKKGGGVKKNAGVRHNKRGILTVWIKWFYRVFGCGQPKSNGVMVFVGTW